MPGQLSLSGDPTAVGHASRKAYVDALARARLAAGGGDVAAHIGSSIDPGATQMIWRAATVVIPWSNTSPNRVTFPAPFPNGFLSVVVSHSSGGNFPLELAAHPVSLGAFDVFLDPLPPTGQLYRIDYIAIGW
jgi:hypothetical protein